MNKEQASSLITEMLQCAINRGVFSSPERQAIQEAHQVLMAVEKSPDLINEEPLGYTG